MTRPICMLLSIMFGIIGNAMAQDQPEPKPTANQVAKSIEATGRDGKKSTLHYWLFLPSKYKAKPVMATNKRATNKSSGKQVQPTRVKQWPLMIFLHGMGERGPADGSKLNKVKIWGPPKLVADKPDFPFVLISPQCPDNVRGWNVEHVNQLVDNAVSNLNVDPKRIYLTGLSMGGYGSWALAAKYPGKFAAVIPVCGGGNPKTADRLKSLPIWVFHGDADSVVPIQQSQKMVDAIKKAGGTKIDFTIYKGVGHNSWTQTYANSKIYDWLLKHRK